MKIALDARCLNRAHLRGMGKYLWNVMTNTPEDAPEWVVLGDRPDLPRHIPDLSAVDVDLFEQRGDRFQLWEQYGLPRAAKRHRADVLHATSTSLPWWQPVPTVVTIHDTVPWEGEGEQCDSWYWRKLLPSAYRQSAAIITISENSRKDILSLWPDLEEKLHVIPHGVESHYQTIQPGPLDEPLRAQGIRSPYLLYLGGGIPRKRVDWAVKVWQELNDPGLQLVVCGLETEAGSRLMESVSPERRENLCLPSFIPEAVMPRLYQNAVAVLYPTLYEGFGLPALESQATGTPVLFSSVGSLSELEGPGAVVLPPKDLGAWVAACQKVLSERSAGGTPDSHAREWARQFSWEESARRHLEVYQSVLARARTGAGLVQSSRS
ncbi:MAG: glycosyltransferase family 4 protein [Planctomycetaceae bacterium]|nr:glycosyltransferase family 4 protein [Planctomycetaceae bacterium]